MSNINHVYQLPKPPNYHLDYKKTPQVQSHNPLRIEHNTNNRFASPLVPAPGDRNQTTTRVTQMRPPPRVLDAPADSSSRPTHPGPHSGAQSDISRWQSVNSLGPKNIGTTNNNSHHKYTQGHHPLQPSPLTGRDMHPPTLDTSKFAKNPDIMEKGVTQGNLDSSYHNQGQQSYHTYGLDTYLIDHGQRHQYQHNNDQQNHDQPAGSSEAQLGAHEFTCTNHTPLETEIQEALEHLQQARQPTHATMKPVQCSTSTSTPLITSDIEENADCQNVLKNPAEDCQEAGTGKNANQIPLAPHPTTRHQNHQALALTPQMRLLNWILESQGGLNYGPDPLTSEGSGQLVMKPDSNQDVKRDISTHDDLPLGTTAGNYRIKKTYSGMISMTSHLVSTPKIKKQITPCRPDTIVNQEETSKLYPTNKAEENIKSPVPSLQRFDPAQEKTLYPNSTLIPEAKTIAEVKNLSKNIQKHVCGECHQTLGIPSRTNHSIRNYFAAQALPVAKINPYYEQYQRMPHVESDNTASISSMWSD